MSYSTTSEIMDMTNVTPGYFAQILFSKGFTSQFSRSYREYDNILMSLKQDQATTERSYQYLLQTAMGVNAIQYQNQGQTDVAFPAGDPAEIQEVTAKMKKLQVTIELDRNVWERLKKAKFKYVDNPLAFEIMNKMDAAKRVQARSLFGDGSGCIGIISSAAASGGKLEVTLSTANTSIGGGNTNWFHKNELVAPCEADGTPITLTGHATGVKWKVERGNRKNKKVVFTVLTSAGLPVTVTDATLSAAAGRLYPVTVLTDSFEGPDVSSPLSIDWGVITPVWAGLESLTANDGRTVFGVVYSGELGGSVFDHNGELFDVSAIEESMNETEQNVGPGKYKYNNIVMPYNAYSSLIEGKEADRRFNSVEDSKRGGRKFIYQYSDQALDCIKSYFCSLNRIFSIPAPAQGEMGETGFALEYRGTDFENVEADGVKTFMKVSNGKYVNTVQSFLEAYTVMIAKQPAAITRIENFGMV